MSHKLQKVSPKDGSQEKAVGRRRFLKQGGLATAFASVASILGLTPFSPAYAATVSAQSTPRIAQLTGHEAQVYIHLVLASQAYQRFQQRIYHNYAGVLTIQQRAATVQSITDSQNTWVQVHVPITGGEGHSYYTVSFQEGSSVVLQTQSALLTLTSERDIVAIMEKDDAIVVDAIVTPKGEMIQGKMYKPDGTQVVLDGLNPQQALSKVMTSLSTPACCLLNGLVLFGLIDVSLGVLLALVCAAPCVVTLGGACAVCISAWAGLTGASIGFVIADCQRNPLTFGGLFGCP